MKIYQDYFRAEIDADKSYTSIEYGSRLNEYGVSVECFC
jgi:hypothetical protein